MRQTVTDARQSCKNAGAPWPPEANSAEPASGTISLVFKATDIAR